MAKMKICSFCGQKTTKLFYANPKCCTRGSCLMQYKNKKYEQENNQSNIDSENVLSSNVFKKKAYGKKPTGEKELFIRIYAERKGICEVTGQQLKFDIWSFLHVLGKKAFPKFRLLPDNILFVHRDIHHYYDNSDKETLLRHFPEAEVIYQKKERLIRRYYNVVEEGNTDGDIPAETED